MNVAEYLEQNENYFTYFKESLTRKIDYFELNFIFGDSVSVKLFYTEKSKYKNFTESLVNLIIPYKIQNKEFGSFENENIETKFEIIKENLKLDIYWKTELENSTLNEFVNKLKIFEGKNLDKLKHYTFNENYTEEKSKQKIIKILEECKMTSKFIKSTKWHPSLQHYAETENYFILYDFSTGS